MKGGPTKTGPVLQKKFHLVGGHVEAREKEENIEKF